MVNTLRYSPHHWYKLGHIVYWVDGGVGALTFFPQGMVGGVGSIASICLSCESPMVKKSEMWQKEIKSGEKKMSNKHK
jgi:hypothetical protein